MLRAGRSLRLALGCLGLVLALMAAASLLGPLLLVRTDLHPSDVIIVLGGDAGPRAALGARLFADGLAPRVLVTGAGDCETVRGALVRRGVPAARIVVECQSRSTHENASRSAAILSELGARSAILVTSWYHTRRALGCFRAASPATALMVAAADEHDAHWRSIRGLARLTVAQEFLKIAWYAARYGTGFGAPASDLPAARGLAP
ncbi:YdcF family protein [Arenibaculum pallidiluteum]|uniref:YdcF family protein n=1 Tax=Arenibaculum pallidiluteum TaxID=2812559 RepID=UPI001A95681F|nr:YdcF family protein [Arenibaculum pallidiluteum]